MGNINTPEHAERLRLGVEEETARLRVLLLGGTVPQKESLIRSIIRALERTDVPPNFEILPLDRIEVGMRGQVVYFIDATLNSIPANVRQVLQSYADATGFGPMILVRVANPRDGAEVREHLEELGIRRDSIFIIQDDGPLSEEPSLEVKIGLLSLLRCLQIRRDTARILAQARASNGNRPSDEDRPGPLPT